MILFLAQINFLLSSYHGFRREFCPDASIDVQVAKSQTTEPKSHLSLRMITIVRLR